MTDYDALLVVSFGGPNGPDDVIPFLENVLRGRNVPRERMLEVAEHYQHFGGVSPINEQNMALIAALRQELQEHGIDLPIYFGNRNWHPLLPDTLREMSQQGVQHALGFFTSVFSSYSGCRQYRENIAAAQQAVGPDAPRVDKIRAFFNHPGFIAAMADRVRDALAEFPAATRSRVPILFTAHSIPSAMAANCQYERQLLESCRLVAEAIGQANWRLVYQSRSGPPSQPWLEPDVSVALRELGRARLPPSPDTNGSAGASPSQGGVSYQGAAPSQELAADGGKDVVLAPIGFISDHMEVLFDLDVEARQTCDELGLHMARAGTVGVHPRFVTMIRELIQERLSDTSERAAIGELPPSHDVCPADCCLYGR